MNSRINFLNWMVHIKNIHYANINKMDEAMCKIKLVSRSLFDPNVYFWFKDDGTEVRLEMRNGELVSDKKIKSEDLEELTKIINNL